MNVGQVLTYNYTGAIQTVNLTDKGLYKLEVWGAQGEGEGGGKGGHSVGYINVENPLSLYLCVGGSAGYNGGGNKGSTYGGHGGGATHVAKVSNTLRNIGYSSFVTNGNGLIVAGGGGGGATNATGGYGGGLTGGNGGKHESYPSERKGNGGNGGSRSSGGNGATGWSDDEGYCYSQSGGFGYGSDSVTNGVNGFSWGGGGGFYGGSGGAEGGFGTSAGGGGGSGYIGGVPAITFKGQTYSPSTENGIRSGNGLATITYVDSSSLPIKRGTVDVVAVKKGTVDVSSMFKGVTPIS